MNSMPSLQSNHTAPFETLYVASQSQSAVRQEPDRRACLPGTIAPCAVLRAEAAAGINYLAGVPPYTGPKINSACYRIKSPIFIINSNF